MHIYAYLEQKQKLRHERCQYVVVFKNQSRVRIRARIHTPTHIQPAEPITTINCTIEHSW